MGVSERKLREKSARKNAIIEAAEQIFFSKGIEKASMDEVAKLAELSKGTLYLYFKNKNALYRAILRRAYTTLYDDIKDVDVTQLNGLNAVSRISAQYIAYASKHPGYFDAILHYENDVIDLDNKEKESVKSIVAGNQVLELIVLQLKRGVADGSINPSLDATKTALSLWGQTTGILQLIKSKNRLLSHYYNVSETELVSHFSKLVIQSLENRHNN